MKQTKKKKESSLFVVISTTIEILDKTFELPYGTLTAFLTHSPNLGRSISPAGKGEGSLYITLHNMLGARERLEREGFVLRNQGRRPGPIWTRPQG